MMWKREGEDWIERRGGRGYATEQPSSLPPVTLPASTSQGAPAAAQALAAGFVPAHFHDEPPKALYTRQDGRHATAAPSAYDALQRDAYNRRRRDLRWVTLLGVAEEQVMGIRDYVDTYIGRTTAHYVPSPRAKQDSLRRNSGSPSLRPCYLQFASSVVAAQVVQAGVLRVELSPARSCGEGQGSASVSCTVTRQRVRQPQQRPRPSRDAEAAGFLVQAQRTCSDGDDDNDESNETADYEARATHVPSSIEFAVSWCNDEAFLQERDRVHQHQQQHQRADTNASQGDASKDSAARCGQRGAAASMTDGIEQQNADESNMRNTQEQSEADSASHTARSVTMTFRDDQTNKREATTTGDRNDSNKHKDAVNKKEYNDAPTYVQFIGTRGASKERQSGVLHSMPCPSTSSPGNMSVLSLFYAQSEGNVWAVVVRLILIVPLTLFRLLAILVGKWGHRRVLATQRTHEDITESYDDAGTGSLYLYLTHWPNRDDTLDSDMSRATLQDRICALFYSCLPFAPRANELDLVVWSLTRHHTFKAHDELEKLQEQLRAIAEADTTHTASGIRSGRQHINARHPLQALHVWRPVWWFARYTILSLLTAMLIALYVCYEKTMVQSKNAG